MTKSVFGDKETIIKVDPYKLILHDGIDLPSKILTCAECDSRLHVEFDDT